jgi:hypothetical protein
MKKIKINYTRSNFPFFALLSLFILNCLPVSHAQPYSSIFGEEKTQFNILTYCALVKGSTIEGLTEKFYFENDTLIEEKEYKKISHEGFYHYPFYSGIREDTDEGKIFVYIKSLGEFLTCDFSLLVGDTFYFPQYKLSDYYAHDLLTVSNGFMIVDAIYYDEGKKTITFDGPYIVEKGVVKDYYWFYSYYGLPKFAFIEGIGPNYGPLDRIMWDRMLLCVTKDNDLIYKLREDLGCESYLCYGNVDEVAQDRIQLFPNPTTGVLRIENGTRETEHENNKGIYPLVIEIFDIYGRKQSYVSRITYNEAEVDISRLSAGIYFVKFQDNQVLKFVKE